MLIENYHYLIAFLGFAFLGVALLPAYLKNSYLTLPIVYIGLGFLLSYIWKNFPAIDPVKKNLLIEKITEITVILSLMGAGIKISQSLKWKIWRPTIRLLLVAMPLFIGLIAILSNVYLGFSLGAAILLGAVLAPTDPVLAGDVQVSSPKSKKKDNKVRFVLTSEAGLNDGLAFPFVYLAGFIVMEGFSSKLLFDWFTYEFLYKIIIGIIVGLVCGKLIGFLLFNTKTKFDYQDGFVAIAITFLTYGLSEIVHGYGFIAVFVAAYFFRKSEANHEYHKQLHDFTEQIEKLLVCILLILFGILLQQGLLNYLTFSAAVIGVVIILILRPLISFLSLWKSGLNNKEKWTISILGIKGIGSFYYLAFALHNFTFESLDTRMIWSLVGFVILISVILHGIAAPIMMAKHDDFIKFRNKKTASKETVSFKSKNQKHY